jgi:ribosomal peptide maturation radical SAM protein 1
LRIAYGKDAPNMKVLLLSMPFGALERQALGISLLKAVLRREDIACDVRYLTFPFAELIGPGTYQWLGYELPYTAFAGDWCFTEALYGPGKIPAGYEDEILRRKWRLTEPAIARIAGVRRQVPLFLDYAFAAVDWSAYDLIGFTSTFEQNIASLALSRRVKQRHPELPIVFGGANWEEEMGLELHRQFSFVDYVCSGEAEQTLARLAGALGVGPRNRERRLAAIPGLVYRDAAGESVFTGKPETPADLDALPAPDYTDYFAALHASAAGSEVLPALLFETSRGCWWGAKSHCTFCGLNGNSMAFRSKSPQRALRELRELVNRWRPAIVETVDNILDMRYFQSFLPALAEAALGVDIFYEVKANLSRRHLRQLRSAGVTRIQPGIESLSDHVLELMRKGTTGLRNIQLMKWSAEYGIQADWNLLYGFPGETAADYEAIEALLPSIAHLPPPSACGPLRLDRFSPYHRDPAAFGIVNLRALDSYRYLYPFPEETLRRITYYFDFDYADGRSADQYAARVIEACRRWRPEQGSLQAAILPAGGIGVLDTRPGARVRAMRFDGWQQGVWELCDTARSAGYVAREVMRQFPETTVSEEGVTAYLDTLVRQGLAATDGRGYVTTAVSKGALRKRLESLEAGPPAAGGALRVVEG